MCHQCQIVMGEYHTMTCLTLLRMQREESKQREEEENAERRGRECREKRERNGETEKRERERLKMSNGLNVIMFSVMFNTWNCLYIDNMCSTSRLGLKPSKLTISL